MKRKEYTQNVRKGNQKKKKASDGKDQMKLY